MNNQIIVDSCCDMTEEMKKEMGIISIPLTMIVGNKEFYDDEFLDMDRFLGDMKSFEGKVGSASPSPSLYQEAIEKSENAFVVTLSSKLSGSFNNAVLAKREAEQRGRDTVHIFDSKTASAGETLIAVKLHELITDGMSKENIIKSITRYIDEIKTYFVLENYDNLQKNGRLNKITGTLIQMLGIKLIMGADGNGEIALFEKCRGVKHMLKSLIFMIENSGRKTDNENVVISHCNNQRLADELSKLIKERFHFKKIYIVPTGGLSSLYVDNKGIVLAF